jgi:outer membrane protein TolC
VAREKLHESEMQNDAVQSCWLPTVTAGVGYYRHEGGIQNEDGTLTHSSTGALFPGIEICGELDLQERTYQRVQAERQVWQQKGELSRVTSENLIEAATSYLDLLLAQRAAAVSAELEKLQQEVLATGEAVQKTDRLAEVVVATTRTELSARRQGLAQLRYQAKGAAARLAYLLGLGPHADPVPLEATVAPVDLVDPTVPAEALVSQALANGPGVRELEGLLSTIDHGLAQSQSLARFLPVLKVNVLEGAFGAGIGGSLDFENRLDVCVSAKWNLTDLWTAGGRKAVAESKRQQAELTLEDLRGCLAARVREARETVLEGREQIRILSEQVQQANAAYLLSKTRFQDSARLYFSEILQSIRTLEQAHMSYLAAVTAYNKAQVRLLVLLGHDDGGHHAPCH